MEDEVVVDEAAVEVSVSYHLFLANISFLNATPLQK